MSIKELQERFIHRVLEAVVEEDDNTEALITVESSYNTLTKLLRIASKEDFIKNINDIVKEITIEDIRHKMTALDFVIFCDTQGYGHNDPKRLNNPILVEVEQFIKDSGGKTSEELGRNLNSHAMEEAIAFEVATAAAVVGVVVAAIAGAALLMIGFASELLKNPGTNLENTTEQPNRQSGPKI